MKIAESYGFSPSNDGITNAKALQDAVRGGGEIYVATPGVYLLANQVLLGDDTTLRFCEGSYIKREQSKGETGYVFINEGAYTKNYNKNISIVGLRLICNGVTSDGACAGSNKVILGLKGQLSFFYIKKISITDFECTDLPSKDFCIQICTFEDAVVENVHIEGMKDAVHFGRGKRFVVRNGVFKTFDDPIALNAHDYVTSNPELGWIEDGVVENCHDLNADDTTGYFCRILAGSWCQWYEGMELQRSDTVVSDGILYRVSIPPDGRVYKSFTRPTHKLGEAEYDGFVWAVVQEGELYNCGCRNIHFKDIFLKKNRPVAFSLHFDKDAYSRSYYPGSEAPVQENLVFENVVVEADNGLQLISSRTPVSNMNFINCTLKNNRLSFGHIMDEGIVYPDTDIVFEGTKFVEEPNPLIKCYEYMRVSVSIRDSVDKSVSLKVDGDVIVKESDINIG